MAFLYQRWNNLISGKRRTACDSSARRVATVAVHPAVYRVHLIEVAKLTPVHCLEEGGRGTAPWALGLTKTD